MFALCSSLGAEKNTRWMALREEPNVNKMIDWTRELDDGQQLTEALLGRLSEISAVLTAIDQGELLCDLPAGPEARARHAAGACLLAILQRDLAALIGELENRLGGQSVDRKAAPHG